MAVFRATNYWRAMLRSRIRMVVQGGMSNPALSSSSSTSRMYSTPSTTLPKMKPFVPTADQANIHHQQNHNSKPSKSAKVGEFIPIYVVMGFVALALVFGVHTAKQQLIYSPSVQVNKKKREMMPEVEQPDHVLGDADKFINKSFFRKMAHIQDAATSDNQHNNVPDSVRGDVFTSPRKAETLKTVGVKTNQK